RRARALRDTAGRLSPTAQAWGRPLSSRAPSHASDWVPVVVISIDHQLVFTEYASIDSSFVTKFRSSATALAIRIRSNGSLCSIGSTANAVTWLARIGSMRAAV